MNVHYNELIDVDSSVSVSQSQSNNYYSGLQQATFDASTNTVTTSSSAVPTSTRYVYSAGQIVSDSLGSSLMTVTTKAHASSSSSSSVSTTATAATQKSSASAPRAPNNWKLSSAVYGLLGIGFLLGAM